VRPAQDLNWLITAFADRVPSPAHALVVSSMASLAFSQGLPLTAWINLPPLRPSQQPVEVRPGFSREARSARPWWRCATAC
jgi:hypothetical protein